MRHIKTLACGLLLAATASCEKVLDFKYNSVEPVPVIEGCIDDAGARVSLTMATPMGEPMDKDRHTDADITVADLCDGSLSSLTADADGYFTASLPAVPGHTYRLTVDFRGTEYSAECFMTAAPEITSMEFSWIHMPYDEVAVLKLTFDGGDGANAGNYYWIRLYRNGEPYRWSICTGAAAENGLISEIFMTTRKTIEDEDEDDLLVDGDIVRACVVEINRDMYDYLTALTSGGSNGPAMFSGGTCAGYFMAAAPAEASVVFHPDSITYYTPAS